MFLSYLMTFTAGVVFAKVVIEFGAPKDNSAVRRLKNSLLSLALLTVFKDKVDGGKDRMYQLYDGTKLPAPSGDDLIAGCGSYYVERTEFMNSAWYTQVMEQRLEAIYKFMDRHLGDPRAIDRFFQAFVEIAYPSSTDKKAKDE